MAAFVPVIAGASAAGAVAYQSWNPPKKQAPESQNAPRNGQDWRLGPTDPHMQLPDYWRNSIRRHDQPIEDAYRSTYNNMYTNAPKLMQDSITGNLRWITPDGNSTNDSTIQLLYRPLLTLFCSNCRPSWLWSGTICILYRAFGIV